MIPFEDNDKGNCVQFLILINLAYFTLLSRSFLLVYESSRHDYDNISVVTTTFITYVMKCDYY